MEPVIVKDGSITLQTNKSEERGAVEIDFPTYLRASRKQLPKPTDSNPNQLAISLGNDSMKESIIKADNFTSFFCPSAFEFQTEEDSLDMKIEEGDIKPNPE